MWQSQSLRSGVGEYMDKKEMPQIIKTFIYIKNMGLILHCWMGEMALASKKEDIHIYFLQRDIF